MGSVTKENSYYTSYTENYKFGDESTYLSDCWFTVSVGKTVYTYNFPPGLVMSIYPETITEKASVNWNSTNILNKNGQLWSYSGTGDRSYSFSFDLAADAFEPYASGALVKKYREAGVEENYYVNGEYKGKSTKKETSISDYTSEVNNEFENVVNGLKRTIYSDYIDDAMYPPLTTFCFDQFKIRGFVASITFTWKKPIIDGKYSKLSVSVEMTQLISSTNNAAITGEYISSRNIFNMNNI